MADIQRLARRAAQILYDEKNAQTEIQAIGLAIRGQGIRHPADVKRLQREVGKRFARSERRIISNGGRPR